MRGMLGKLFQFHNEKQFEVEKTIMFSAASDIGQVRETNQDNLYVMRQVLGHEELAHYAVSGTESLPVLFAVCDGMGGGKNGEQASYLAVQSIAEVDVLQLAQKSDAQLEAFFIQLCQRINGEIFAQYGCAGTLVGCTVTLLYIDAQRVYFVNVGDSPGMCYANHDLHVETYSDNRANQLYLLGHISERERWVHRTKNQLTQYLGMNPEEVRISPHIHRMDRLEERALYLICSDGLLDRINFQDLEELLGNSPVKGIAKACICRAIEAGSRDNITAIVVQLEAERK